MSAHTPGPWTLTEDWQRSLPKLRRYIGVVRRDDAGFIYRLADIYGTYGTDSTRQADARLIAAAPDLLAALKSLLEIVADNPSYCEECERHAPKHDDGTLAGPIRHAATCPIGIAHAAIAKAEGAA